MAPASDILLVEAVSQLHSTMRSEAGDSRLIAVQRAKPCLSRKLWKDALEKRRSNALTQTCYFAALRQVL